MAIAHNLPLSGGPMRFPERDALWQEGLRLVAG
jgi:hypothetical protein